MDEERDITSQVYETLFDGFLDCQTARQELEDFKSSLLDRGITMTELVNHYPEELESLKGKGERRAANMFEDCRAQLKKFSDDVTTRERLDPAALDADVLKLLGSGVSLTPQDIEGLLERCQGNRTMLQLIERTARERGVWPRGLAKYQGANPERQTADTLAGTLRLLEKWASEPGGLETLDAMFSVLADPQVLAEVRERVQARRRHARIWGK